MTASPEHLPVDSPGSSLARSFLAGIVEGDLDRLRSVLHPDATWSVPGHTSISGVANGADAIVDRAQSIYSGGVEIELQYLLEGFDGFGALLHNTGHRGGVTLDEQVVLVFAAEDGQITRIANLISDVRGLDAYFTAAS